jgi:hypothetical protein
MAVKRKNLNSKNNSNKTMIKNKKHKTSKHFQPIRFLTSGTTPEMNNKQLKSCTKKVNQSAKNLKLVLLSVYISQGWIAGGYDSFKDYVLCSLNITYNAALKQAIAAEVAYKSIGFDAVGKFSDASMLAMKGFTYKEQKKILNRACEQSPHDPINDHSLTASQVKKAIEDLNLRTSKQEKEEETVQKRPKKLKDFEAELKNQSDDIPVAKALITAFAKTQSSRNIKAAIKFLSSHLEEES